MVWKGRRPGIYTTWAEAEAQVKGFAGARYQKFENLALAEEAFRKGETEYSPRKNLSDTEKNTPKEPRPVRGIAVDGACNMVTGVAEYRGVDLSNGKVLFKGGPYPHATNNIVEFLAIVHALAYCEKYAIPHIPVYSDSQIAINWVRRGKANTLKANPDGNSVVHDLIQRAEHWLATHSWRNPLLKWDTKRWGEIPADFGRK